jgi:hypothetical protein
MWKSFKKFLPFFLKAIVFSSTSLPEYPMGLQHIDIFKTLFRNLHTTLLDIRWKIPEIKPAVTFPQICTFLVQNVCYNYLFWGSMMSKWVVKLFWGSSWWKILLLQELAWSYGFNEANKNVIGFFGIVLNSRPNRQ